MFFAFMSVCSVAFFDECSYAANSGQLQCDSCSMGSFAANPGSAQCQVCLCPLGFVCY